MRAPSPGARSARRPLPEGEVFQPAKCVRFRTLALPQRSICDAGVGVDDLLPLWETPAKADDGAAAWAALVILIDRYYIRTELFGGSSWLSRLKLLTRDRARLFHG